MYVNAGANAVKILQRLLTQMGYPCDPDGQIGPQTIRAAQTAYDAAPTHLADAYGIARRNYYYAVADGRPASRKYARRRDGGKGGWIIRAEELHLAEVSPDGGAAPRTGGGMGVIDKVLGGPAALWRAGAGGQGGGRGLRALGHQADGAVGRGADGGPAAVGRGISAPRPVAGLTGW